MGNGNCVQVQEPRDIAFSTEVGDFRRPPVQQAVNDAILTLTIVTPSGESKGTFEVRAAERPLDLLRRMEFEKCSEGQLLIGDNVLISDKTFVEQDVCSGAELTLVVMPLGARFFAEGFDPEQLCFEEDRSMYCVKLFYNGTKVCETGITWDYSYFLSTCKYFLVPTPLFNAPLFAADGVARVDVLQELRKARAKGLIQ